MAITRWQPFADMHQEMKWLQNEMNRVFGRFNVAPSRATAYPALDIWQDDHCLYVEAGLPGLKMSDLEIFVTGEDQLSIRGVRKTPSNEGGMWLRQERGLGQFSRLFDLPIGVDVERVEASLKNGVLTIKLPKREDAKPRKITVTTG